MDGWMDGWMDYKVQQNNAVSHTIRPWHPLHEGLVKSWRLPSYRTGCNQYHVAGLLARARHCSDTAAIASLHHRAYYRKHDVISKTGKDIITYSNSGRGELSDDHAQSTCIDIKNLVKHVRVVSEICVRTDRQTDRHAQSLITIIRLSTRAE